MIIITHGGPAHQDEFLAICIVIALDTPTAVYRRNPTEEECVSPDVMVIDVGRSHDPKRLMFDHHHLFKGGAGRSSLHLIADHYALDLAPFAWANVVGLIDCGENAQRRPLRPAAWGGHPMVRHFLDQFKRIEKLIPSDPLWKDMLSLGTLIAEEAKGVKEDVESLTGSISENGVCDARGWSPLFAATDIVGNMQNVDFILLDGRDPGTTIILKKGPRGYPEYAVENAIFTHASNFMMVIDNGHLDKCEF